jgi:hypothetical protein
VTELSAYTRGRLQRIADDALRRAGVLGVVPTPLDAVADAAAIDVAPVAALAPPDTGVLGALWFEERTLFLERRQSPVRRRFTQAHELMHALCPWHRDVLRTDTAAELFGPVTQAIEAEANAGAGLLIFGGSRFAPGPLSMAHAIALAEAHRASVHATLHHCVQTDRGSSALLVAGRFPQRDGSLPVWRSIESVAFRRRHGRASAHAGDELAAGSPLRELAEQARVSRRLPALPLTFAGRRFVAEAHDNRHAVFVLLTPAACVRRAAG